MKTKIALDLKSLLVGAAVAAVLIFTLGATSAPTDQTGRYQIAVGDGGCAGIVDTATGQAWSVTLQNIQATPNNLNSVNNFYAAKNK